MGMFDTKSFVDVMYKNICEDPVVPQWVEAQLYVGNNAGNEFVADATGQTITNLETTVVTTAANYLIPVALVISAMFFLLGLLELGMSERMSPDLFVKTFAKLGVSIALIYAAPAIVTAGGDLSDAILGVINSAFNDLTGGSQAKEAIKKAIEDTVKGMGLWKRIMLWMNMNLFQGIANIGCIFIATTLISRRIELIIRGSFMPIAMSFVTTEGWQAGSIRYLKKYIAIWLQGPAIALIIRMSSMIYFSVLTSGLASGKQSGGGLVTPILPLLLSIATIAGVIGAIRGSQQVMNDVMGA